MPTVEELTVALREEGMDETVDGLENVEGRFEDTSDAVGESADEMNSFASQWQGAMGAVVAGLAVASAGLLSQIPVIGELFGGLVSVIEALAFQMDKVLRPVLTPITNALFDLSSIIFELEGPLGTLVGIIGTFAAIIGGAIAVLIPFQGVVGAIATVFGVLLSPLGAVIAAIAAFVAIWVTDFLGIRTKIMNALNALWDILTDIGGWLAEGISNAFNWLVNAVNSPKEAVEDIWNVLTDIGSWATNAIGGAFDWLEDALSGPISFVNDLLDTLEEIVSETWDTIVDISLELLGFDQETFESGQSQTVGGGLPGTPTFTVPGANTSSGSSDPSINMDGRRLNEDTGRYRSDQTSRRGRFG